MAICIAAWSLGSPMRSNGAYVNQSDQAMKAAYLCRLGSFVDWPPGVLTEDQFTIAVLDDDGVGKELEHLLPRQKIKHRRVQYRPVTFVAELTDARILYIGPGHRQQLSQIVAQTARRPILIVTSEQAAS